MVNHRQSLIKISHLMHSKGLVCSTDGNLSIKLSDNRFLITRSGINKGLISDDDLLVIDRNGEVLEGARGYKVSSEWRMHLKAYELRADVGSVIHSHPPCVTAYTVSGVDFPDKILPEVVLTMGKIPVTEYSQPCSPRNADIINEIKNYDALILQRHGVLTVGEDIFAAYNRLEKLEHVAFTAMFAKLLGACNSLPEDEIKSLMEIGKKSGFLRS